MKKPRNDGDKTADQDPKLGGDIKTKIDPQDQLVIYEGLTRIFWKNVLSLILVVAFIIILYRFLTEDFWGTKAIYAGVDSLIGIALNTMLKHYFPSGNSDS